MYLDNKQNIRNIQFVCDECLDANVSMASGPNNEAANVSMWSAAENGSINMSSSQLQALLDMSISSLTGHGSTNTHDVCIIGHVLYYCG